MKLLPAFRSQRSDHKRGHIMSKVFSRHALLGALVLAGLFSVAQTGTASAACTKGKIFYTLANKSNQPVKFKLPTGKTYTLKVGQKGKYRNTGCTEKFKMFVFNSGRTYSLESGQHKFWWNKKAYRIGFDKHAAYD
jgi:hypothetical protein